MFTIRIFFISVHRIDFGTVVAPSQLRALTEKGEEKAQACENACKYQQSKL
jgi:hypothetical protein